MSYIDLQHTMHEWPYEPDKISVRKILSVDSTVRLQMRVELGILQMEAEGRPDGQRPFHTDSMLSHYEQELGKHERRNGTQLGFSLSLEDCQKLRVEASLYYRRYVAYFVLEEYANVWRDTSHNLGITNLCRDHALEEDDRTFLEEYRPYLLMMDARARAYHAVEEGEPASALAHVNRGILDIRTHLESFCAPEVIETSEELKTLRTMSSHLGKQVPQDSLIVTRKALRTAIKEERFEEAARLRDELKEIYRD